MSDEEREEEEKALTVLPASAGGILPGILDEEIERTRAFVRAARADATHRAYDSDWRVFLAWCEARGLDPLPASPQTVAVFLSVQATGDTTTSPPRPARKVATLSRYLAAINYRHKQARLATPGDQDGGVLVREAFAGIRRRGRNDKTQKSAADGERLRAMLATIVGDDVRSARDRALLALGMAAALRRSELVALQFDDILFRPEGLSVLIRSSKTDQTGEGVSIAVPEGSRIRPKALLLEWLRVGRVSDGPLFRALVEVREKVRDPETREPMLDPVTGKAQFRRLGDRVQSGAMSDRTVALVVKARAEAAGLDPALFAGHSLRSGFLTEAARQPNANIFKMREVSRHKSLDILAAYVREHDKFRDHAGQRFL
ncbi:Site-specific recombinase XerD [Sphingomonas gellani]|uniref:Site-specific recombinase XerD n=1 Tax=Sphingomonas gellani TaxID=1166340 RepID=A0A1H8I7U0_9SPHN|nr:tyrosine-type recombinase/integrase [Sphingomonas gellani]SEN64743.1 Site-specific recombinase XerD [Sphingomonas gellani]